MVIPMYPCWACEMLKRVVVIFFSFPPPPVFPGGSGVPARSDFPFLMQASIDPCAACYLLLKECFLVLALSFALPLLSPL